MAETQLHADEIVADPRLVRSLLTEQFPQWAHLPLRRVASAGTDNVMYRLGDSLAVRLPRRPSAVYGIRKERSWLPHLAAHLPVEIPEPVGMGEPADGFPLPWSVYRWLDGADATKTKPDDQHRFAHDLAEFITVLHTIDMPGASTDTDALHTSRSGPLVTRDDNTRERIEACRQLPGLEIDLDAVTEVWNDAVTRRDGYLPDCWNHADLMAPNLLIADGRLSAVIDFGTLSIGNPTVDYAVAWGMFDHAARVTFRRAVNVDDDTWARAQGWALSFSLNVLPYYWTTNRGLVDVSLHRIAALLDDYRQ